MSWSLVWEHLFIVLASGILSLLIGLPLGVLAYLSPKLRPLILRVVDLLQTIPSLALLGMIMVFLGPGKITVILGITLYSLLPIVRNTCLGLQEVDPGIKEAARGMGMGRTYRLLNVEFPLAFPTVFTGIRIAFVNAIGSAVFAAFVGGGGLGSILNRGIRVQDMGLILQGTGALMVIAMVLDLLMGLCENKLKNTKGSSGKAIILPMAAIALFFVILLPFGLGEGVKENELILYEGEYSERQLLHHMVKMLVEENTELTVTIKDEMTGVNAFKELIGDTPTHDLMSSYDGTILTTYLKEDTSDIPEGMSLYDYTNQRVEELYDVRTLDKFGFDNTYAIAVPQSVADQYGLETVSDLVPIADQLVFGAEQEFFTLEGSMKYNPFVEFYGLHFKDAKSVDLGLKYAAVENGSFQVTEVYATDGLNIKANLKILEDDLGFFPEYNGALLVRNDLFERFQQAAPNLEEVLNSLGGKISTEEMAQMTYEVDVQGRSVDAVAHEFLTSIGLLNA